HKIITSPTGMDSNVNRALSLYLIMAISPMMKPTSPINARAGVGRGNLIAAPSPTILMAISTMNAIVKPAAHCPAFVWTKTAFS
ncbi:MAG: hypothetical protein IPF67_20550, partial [Saprospiraceae bacterium]|nr:hypothetical protein [Candidatus Brachybacter algidus]